MKRILGLLFALAFAAPALAVDNPVTCTAASCKIIFAPRNGSATAIVGGQVDGNGVWTFGAAAAGNSSGQRHLVSGGLWSTNVTSSDASGEFWIGNNTRGSSATAGNGRTQTASGGIAIVLDNRTSDSSQAYVVIANKVGDSTGTTGTAIMQASQDGTWTIGATGSTNTQTINGVLGVNGLFLFTKSTGYYANQFLTTSGVNLTRDFLTVTGIASTSDAVAAHLEINITQTDGKAAVYVCSISAFHNGTSPVFTTPGVCTSLNATTNGAPTAPTLIWTGVSGGNATARLGLGTAGVNTVDEIIYKILDRNTKVSAFNP